MVLAPAVLFGTAARAESYRCLMMNEVVSAPCCPLAEQEPPADSSIGAPCVVRIPGSVSALRAAETPHESALSAAPFATAIVWPTVAAILPPAMRAATETAARGSPPERLRTATIVLRV